MAIRYNSVFGEYLESMIEFKTALGYSPKTYEPRSRSFDRYCVDALYEGTELTKELVTGWINTTDASISEKNARVSFCRCFGRYLRSIGLEAYIFPDRYCGGKTSFQPYIFAEKEMSELFRQIDRLSKDVFQQALLSAYFRLMYTSGLRPEESRRIRLSDINFSSGRILVRARKKHRERIIVMSDDMLSLLKKYRKKVLMLYPGCDWLFPNANGEPYPASWYQMKMKTAFRAANPKADPDLLPSVRVYDLRHMFATTALHRWLDNKEDLYARLPYLRMYMGHTNLNATAYYVHLLPETLVQSSGVDWKKMTSLIPEVELWEE